MRTTKTLLAFGAVSIVWFGANAATSSVRQRIDLADQAVNQVDEDTDTDTDTDTDSDSSGDT